MAKMRMQNATTILDLDSISHSGYGYEVLSGVSGLGMASRNVQWVEGAGDGARYRGKRVNSRSIDIPLHVLGVDRTHLLQLVAALELMLAEPFTLYFVEDNGTEWYCDVVFTGGFNPVYGTDTIGNVDLTTVITVQAGDPYWTSAVRASKSIKITAGAGNLLSNLVALPVSSGSVIGSITLENTGTAPAYPTWEVYGPGDTFTAISPKGETLKWNGSLADGEILTLDAIKGTVTDQDGVNRYAELDTAPRFWSVTPGVKTVTASLSDATTASKIVCSWRTRKWLVI